MSTVPDLPAGGNAGGQSESPTPAGFDPAALLDLPDRERFESLSAAVDRARDAEPDRGGTGSLLEAVLAVDPGTDAGRRRRWKLAALEVAALAFPDALEVAGGRIAERARGLGLQGFRADRLVAEAREILARLGRPDPDRLPTRTRVLDVWPDAPVGDDAVLPNGWTVTPGGVRGQDGVAAPVLLAGRVLEDGTDRCGVELVGRTTDDRWIHCDVPRLQIADHRRLVELADRGIGVNTLNAPATVAFLADYEAANAARLPAAVVTPQLGWTADGRAFLWGRDAIRGDAGPAVRFRSADPGTDRLADGWRAGGTPDGWRELLAVYREYHRVYLAVLAAVAPPLLRVVGADNFALDVYGPTSSGKTTLLRAAAGGWGSPRELVETWNATATFRERTAGLRCGLPILWDDSKTLPGERDREAVANTVYGLSQGVGRGRGTRDGVAVQARFETVMVSTGEAPLVGFTQDGGTRPRVLTLSGLPFDRADGEAAKVVNRVRDSTQEHYGHAGPAVVRYLIGERDRWDRLRAEHRELAARFEGMAKGDPVVGRAAGSLACLALAERVLLRAVAPDLEPLDPVGALWAELTAAAADDRPRAALLHAYETAAANPDRFAPAAARTPAPPGGWWGRRSADLVEPGTRGPVDRWVGYLDQPLREVLGRAGFRYDEVVPVWRQRGWLRIDKDGQRNTMRSRMEGDTVRVVAILLDEVEKLLQAAPDTPTTGAGDPGPALGTLAAGTTDRAE